MKRSTEKLAQLRYAELSAAGHRVGEGHPNSSLTRHDVELMRDLRETYRLTIREVAEKFEIPWSTARDILSYKTWAVPPARVKLLSARRQDPRRRQPR